jgi:hypothetical protein
LTSGLARRHVCENTLKWSFSCAFGHVNSAPCGVSCTEVKSCRWVLEQNGRLVNLRLSSRIGCTLSVSSPVAPDDIIAAYISAACFGISGNYLVCYYSSCSVTHITNTSGVSMGLLIL